MGIPFRLAPPVLWAHIVKNYCKALLICLFGIVGLLLSTKLEEMARFVALGASLSKIGLFVLYQIPYLLQIALPISSLVAGFTTLFQMSIAGEVTAARASGYSLSTIITPISCCSLLISLVMMWGMFDLSAKCHLAAKKLEYDVREEEPLSFVQCSRFLADHGASLELTGSLRSGASARDVLLALRMPGNDRLSLIILKHATSEGSVLNGSAMTILSSKPPQLAERPFGSLLIENAEKKQTPTQTLHELTAKTVWRVGADHLPLAVVRAQRLDFARKVAVADFKGHEAKKFARMQAKFTSEPFRRLSLSLSVFTLGVAGAICGIRTSRVSRRWLQRAAPIAVFGIFIASYLAGKNLDDLAPAAIFFYLISHPVLWRFSSILKNRLEYGMEC